MRQASAAIAASLLVVFGVASVHSARADDVLVSAAASLTDAMNAIGKAYTADHPGTTVRFNFGASGVLQKQIEQGAPVDVFASASPKEMDALQKANKIEVATRFNFAGNRLVLIVPAASKTVRDWRDLASPRVQPIAISEPATVPSGRYAQQTLTHRGLWAKIQPKLVRGGNVRQTLSYVADNNADAGIVFATDARVEKRVHIVAIATPGVDHDPIVYPAAVVINAPNPTGARGFAAFLKGTKAQKILAGFGFSASPRSATPGFAAPTPRR